MLAEPWLLTGWYGVDLAGRSKDGWIMMHSVEDTWNLRQVEQIYHIRHYDQSMKRTDNVVGEFGEFVMSMGGRLCNPCSGETKINRWKVEITVLYSVLWKNMGVMLIRIPTNGQAQERPCGLAPCT